MGGWREAKQCHSNLLWQSLGIRKCLHNLLYNFDSTNAITSIHSGDALSAHLYLILMGHSVDLYYTHSPSTEWSYFDTNLTISPQMLSVLLPIFLSVILLSHSLHRILSYDANQVNVSYICDAGGVRRRVREEGREIRQ